MTEDNIKISPLTPIIHKVPGALTNSRPLRNSSFSKHRIKLKIIAYHNGEKYDLTSHVLQVKTHMAIGEPTGRFTVLLTFKKRWDNLLFPMDYIEISFSRYLNEPPVMMRGFIGNVRRTRLIDNSGKIHRAVTINGENFGKIWNNYKIEYLVQEIGQRLQGNDISLSLTYTPLIQNMLTENYGIASTINPSGSIKNIDFINEIRQKMINAYIEVLQQINPQIPSVNYAANINNSYQITNSTLVQSVENISVYELIKQFGNTPWCEYFIDDYTSGPTLFYRNTPFKTEDGKLIDEESNPQTASALAEYFDHPEISDADVIEEDVGTSDNEIYSYFFTYPALAYNMQVDPRAEILGTQALTFEQEADTQILYNPHVDLENLYRFGFRPLIIATNSIPLEAETEDSKKLTDESIAQALEMNSWLIKAFVWTAKMKNGTMKVKGNEHLRIGRYVTQTSTNEEYYIESVDHEITFSQVGSLGNDQVYSFETTIGVTRGRNLGG